MIQYITAKLSKILKTDIRYFAKGGFYLSLSQISSALISTGLTIAFANLLPVETFGTYRYILSLYSLAAVLALPGIDTAIIQSISTGHDKSFKEGLIVKTKWSFLATLALFAFGVWKYAEGGHQLGLLVIVIGAFLPLMEPLALSSSFFNAKKLYKVWTVCDIATQVFSAIVMVATLFVTTNIFYIIIAYFVPNIIARIISIIIIRRYYIENQTKDPELMSYSRSLSLFQLISRVISSIDQIVLFHFLGPAQVAIFSLATAVPTKAQSFFKISGILAMPRFTSRDYYEVNKSFPKKLLLFGIGIFICCVIYVLVAPLIFTYIFPKYLISLSYSQIAIFYTLSSITYPFGSLLYAHKKIRENYVLSFGNLIVKVLSLAIFVPLYGVWGAIISLLASSLTVTLISFYYIFTSKKEIVS